MCVRDSFAVAAYRRDASFLHWPIWHSQYVYRYAALDRVRKLINTCGINNFRSFSTRLIISYRSAKTRTVGCSRSLQPHRHTES